MTICQWYFYLIIHLFMIVLHVSLAMMTYARELDLPVGLIFGSSESVSGQVADVTTYVASLSNQVEKVHHLVHNKLAQAAEKQKKHIYDLKQFHNSYKVAYILP